MPIRKFLPIIGINALVILTVSLLIVRDPSHARSAALVMPLLLVANFVFIRRIQKRHIEAVASGTAGPQSPAQTRVAVWALGLWAAASFVSGAFDLPELINQHDFGPWLGWSVKMIVGTCCIWIVLRIRRSRKTGNPD